MWLEGVGWQIATGPKAFGELGGTPDGLGRHEVELGAIAGRQDGEFVSRQAPSQRRQEGGEISGRDGEPFPHRQRRGVMAHSYSE